MNVRTILSLAVLVASLFSTALVRADDDARKEEARNHFEIGLAHFDREEYSAALAEFLKSRELFPTRSATKNAAICLRKEKRFDEALEMFEALLREFPNLPPTDHDLANKEISELQGSVGSLEVRGAVPGATIVVDGRTRGSSPIPPFRVATGTHIVRVYKEGYAPFEVRVDLAGRITQPIDVRMMPLERSGRLRVTEKNGRVLDVVVDNVVVGKTPWEGPLALGEHTVLLRGDDVGTQPARTPVREQGTETLNLEATPLEASLRIDPTPATATVAIDGIAVGRGVWEGPLRVGAHDVELAADGFVPQKKRLMLVRNQREVLAVALERDLDNPMWVTHRSRVVLEVAAGPSFALGSSQITGSTPAIGFQTTLRVGWELPSGVGFFGEAGFLALFGSSSGRATQVQADTINVGTADDSVRVTGATFGGAIGWHRGEAWTFTGRLGAGGIAGAAFDRRTGTFTNGAGETYRIRSSPDGSTVVDGLSDAAALFYLYAAPEVRIGRRIGKRIEVSIGVQGLFAFGLASPSWSDDRFVPTSPNAPQQRGDGPGRFPRETMFGGVRAILTPSVGVRADF